MNNLFKILVFTSPVLAIVFFYIVSQMSKLDVEMQRQDAAFERSWNEFESKLSGSIPEKRIYDARAKEAEKKMKELEAKEAEKAKKSDEFMEEFEHVIEDKDTQKELERRMR